jgi:hypothetical protein
LFPRFFIKPAGWVSLSTTPLFVLGAVSIALLTYLYSFLAMRGSHGD